MPTTADRVRGLIATSGLTHRTFAERVGLDPTKLSKSLAGARRFTSLELARISDLSDVTVDWLISGEEPELAVAARSTGGTAATAVHEAQRLSTMRSDLAFIGFPQPWAPLGPDSAGEMPRTADDRARFARMRVAEAGRSVSEPDLASLVEGVFGVDVTICDLGEGFDGLSVSSEEVKLILVATSRIPSRQRFTIAHELGHLLVGDDQQLHVDADIYNADYRLDQTEREANAFAAGFLMPEERLAEAMESGQLSGEMFAALVYELGVSPTSLALRLRNLRLIDSDSCDAFRQLSTADAARLAGRGEQYAEGIQAAGASRPPGLLLKDAYRAYETGEATLRLYAALIGDDVDRLRESLESR